MAFKFINIEKRKSFKNIFGNGKKKPKYLIDQVLGEDSRSNVFTTKVHKNLKHVARHVFIDKKTGEKKPYLSFHIDPKTGKINKKSNIAVDITKMSLRTDILKSGGGGYHQTFGKTRRDPTMVTLPEKLAKKALKLGGIDIMGSKKNKNKNSSGFGSSSTGKPRTTSYQEAFKKMREKLGYGKSIFKHTSDVLEALNDKGMLKDAGINMSGKAKAELFRMGQKQKKKEKHGKATLGVLSSVTDTLQSAWERSYRG